MNLSGELRKWAVAIGCLAAATAYVLSPDRGGGSAEADVTRSFGGGASITPTSPAQYTAYATAEWQGSTSAVQCPTATAKCVWVKAAADNTGSVAIGFSSGVTLPDGATDTTTGWVLEAGEEKMFFVTNTNLLYRICTNATDDCVVLIAN